MKRLFWRIFAAFWVASVVLLFAVAWFTASSFESEEIPGLGITRLQAALDDRIARAARELRRNGERGLREWLAITHGLGALRVYVFDSNGRELLEREHARKLLAGIGPLPAGSMYGSERTRARRLHGRDGSQYVAVATLEGNFVSRLFARRSGGFWLDLAVAMVVSAIVGLLLAWYVAAPLQRIRASARDFAEGDLSARVGRLRFGRSAEIVALASEFDHMAERISNLVVSNRRLVRDVSHELRSPLARMRVALELARDTDPARRDPALDRIEREADRLAAMLAQSLELSRLETDQTPPHDRVALDRLLDDVIANAEFEGAPRGRKVVLAECERIEIDGWYDALHSALENVVRNALAYTADGTTVGVRLGHAADDPNHARIVVRDHGPGVGESDLARIFEPFYRTDAARTRSSGGTGLGLAIAQRAIVRHGGTIAARNAAGGGLEITIRLPVTRIAAAPARPQPVA
jgi:two-component system sensor histidine kinase CpxA